MDITFDQKKIETLAVDAIVERFFDEHYDLRSDVQRIVADKVDKAFGAKIEEKILIKIDECLKDAFNKEYTKRTAWGETQGEPTTVAKELEKIFSDYWQEKVDKQGKKSSGYGTTDRASWVLKTIATDEFMKMVQQDIINLGGLAKDTLRAELRKSLDEMLNKTFHVKSTVDQEEKGGKYGKPLAKN